MTTFRVGETAYYEEDGARHKVEILENRCNGDRESYRLRVLETLANHPACQTKQPGEEFSCDQTPAFKIWSLTSAN